MQAGGTRRPLCSGFAWASNGRVFLQWCRDRVQDAITYDLPADVRGEVENRIAEVDSVIDAKSNGPDALSYGSPSIFSPREFSPACETEIPFVRPIPQIGPWRHDRGRIVS
jgi:hypothetical protein